MGGAPTKPFEDLVLIEYWGFKDIFLKKSFDQLPAWKPWDHTIELTPGYQPFSTKVYPMSPNEQKELDNFLEENSMTQIFSQYLVDIRTDSTIHWWLAFIITGSSVGL